MKTAVAVALIALIAAVGASAAPPAPSVTCTAGGKTSIGHLPHGTNNVMFVYDTGNLSDIVTWVGGQRSFATPTDVTTSNSVVATFFDGATQLDTAQASCS